MRMYEQIFIWSRRTEILDESFSVRLFVLEGF